MSFKFSTEVRVRLPETDALGIVFHGYFFTYFDVGRMDYLRNLRLIDAFGTGQGRNLLVHAEADFRSPARFDDVLVVHARVGELGKTSLAFFFRVTHRREARLVAEGKTVHVMIDPTTCRPVPVPEEIRAAVRAFEGPDLRERPNP
jgi:acyl-CoA thioester hydrolase